MSELPIPTSESPNTAAQGRSPLLVRLTAAAGLAGMRPSRATRVDDPFNVQSARLTFRPLSPRDRDEYVRVLRASRASLDAYCPVHTANETDEQAFEWQLALSDAARHTGRAWRSVAFAADGSMIGCFNINNILRGLENTGELVLWVSDDAAGHGYAGEGIAAVLEHAFGALPGGLGLDRLTALIAPSNLASIRVAGKCGFRLSPAHASIEIILSGRPALHDVYVAHAPLPGPAPKGRAAGKRAAGLRNVLAIEAAIMPHAA